MGRPSEIHDEKVAFLTERQSLLERKVKRIQTGLWSILFRTIMGLEVDTDGKIKNTAANTGKINRGVNVAFASLRSSVEGKTGLGGWIANQVLAVIGFNRKYAEAVSSLSLTTVEQRAAANYLARLGWSGEEIVEGSWLDSLAASADVKRDVFSRMFQATNTPGGISQADFVKQFRDDFTGKNKLGFVERRWQMFTDHYLIGTDREVSGLYAEAGGMDYFIYSGTEIKTTRPFCEANLNKIFHKSIFAKWNGQSWAGKIPGAPVEQVLGGYGPCRHQRQNISEDMARRMIKAGRKHGLTDEQLAELMDGEQ